MFRWTEIILFQRLIEEESDRDFCGAIVLIADGGDIKGQFLPVFESTHVAFQLSLELKF